MGGTPPAAFPPLLVPRLCERLLPGLVLFRRSRIPGAWFRSVDGDSGAGEGGRPPGMSSGGRISAIATGSASAALLSPEAAGEFAAVVWLSSFVAVDPPSPAGTSGVLLAASAILACATTTH